LEVAEARADFSGRKVACMVGVQVSAYSLPGSAQVRSWCSDNAWKEPAREINNSLGPLELLDIETPAVVWAQGGLSSFKKLYPKRGLSMMARRMECVSSH